MTILYEVRDTFAKDKDAWKEITRTGIEIQDPISKELLELFPIKIFAEALCRNSDIVKKWTKAGSIPKPLWKIQGKQCTHFYSASQIINCHLLMRTKYGGRKYLNDVKLHQQFLDDITKLWYQKEVVVQLDGTFEVTK